MEKNLKVKCPSCQSSFNYFDSPFRPFCTERCQMIDLGHWFLDSYAVKGEDVKLEQGLEQETQEENEDYEY